MSLRDELSRALAEARERAIGDGAITVPPGSDLPPVGLERPANADHGDWASNVAMQLAPVARRTAEDRRSHRRPPGAAAGDR